MQDQKIIQASGFIILLMVLINIVIIKTGYMSNENWYMALIVTVPLLMLAIYKHLVKENNNNYTLKIRHHAKNN